MPEESSVKNIPLTLTRSTALGTEALMNWELFTKLRVPKRQVETSAGKTRYFLDLEPKKIQDLMGLQSAERVGFVIHRLPVDIKVEEKYSGSPQSLVESLFPLESLSQALKTWAQLWEVPSPLRVRVSCRKAGGFYSDLSSMEVGRLSGEFLKRLSSESCDIGNIEPCVKDAHIELRVLLNDEMALSEFPLLEAAKEKKVDLESSGLSQPVAWALCTTAGVKEKSTILDPMCGAGVILREARSMGAAIKGVEKDEEQLAKAQANGLGEVVCSGNASALPFPPCSFDCVICDLPFGQQWLSKEECEKRYPEWVGEFGRVLKEEGKMVLLTSQDLYEVLCSSLPPSLHFCEARQIPLGFTSSVALSLVKRKKGEDREEQERCGKEELSEKGVALEKEGGAPVNLEEAERGEVEHRECSPKKPRVDTSKVAARDRRRKGGKGGGVDGRKVIEGLGGSAFPVKSRWEWEGTKGRAEWASLRLKERGMMVQPRCK